MSDRAFDLSKDLPESRLALAEIVGLVSRIGGEPGSSADTISRQAMAAVELLQNLMASRALLEQTTRQAFRLLEEQPHLWESLHSGEQRLPAVDKLADAWPALERLEPTTETETRLQTAMLEHCRYLCDNHDVGIAVERLIERAWRHLDGLVSVLPNAPSRVSSGPDSSVTRPTVWCE